jgi:hypothetical protein
MSSSDSHIRTKDKSWRWITFPQTEIRLKIVAEKWNRWNTNSGTRTPYIHVYIKLDANQYDKFTQKDVDNFIDDLIMGEG